MKVNIRTEQESDWKDIEHIHCQAFGSDDEANLVEQLRASAIPLLSLHFNTLPFRYQFKRGQGDPFPAILCDVDDQDETDASVERSLLCKFCRQHITSVDKAIQIQNSHQHIFTNPAGDTFRIGCFSSAPGCSHRPPPTMEFTWFKGFSWQVTLCANCLVQMGWFYQAADTTYFYGLILNHLIENG